MFTGIVEEIGQVRRLDLGEHDARLEVVGTVADDAAHGDSIAVNGVCLTVTEHGPDWFRADVMPETLARTALGGLTEGDPVNLERAVPVSGRLGGHVVQGHVDGVGRVTSREPGEAWDVVTVSLPSELAPYVARKGSITVDGVSLTVTSVTDETFSVSLIPTTLAETTLGARQVGDPVNLEVDVLARYTRRMLQMEAR
jgi:riboflavin synthase